MNEADAASGTGGGGATTGEDDTADASADGPDFSEAFGSGAGADGACSGAQQALPNEGV